MTSLEPYAYVGSELSLFAQAHNWKTYFARTVGPYLGERVIEVGAGIGGTTAALCQRRHARWVCMEPDRNLAGQLRSRLVGLELPTTCEVVVSVMESLPSSEVFDSAIYIDVLEHIENDREELRYAADHLAPGGTLVVLSPAHQQLFTPFDKAVGHFRRYTTTSLQGVAPPGFAVQRLIYLDSIGLAASLANRLFLQASMPSQQQVIFWDRALVPLSRVVDPILGYRLGKSVLGIWKKT